MLLRRGPGVLQRLLTPPGVHSAFTEHMIKERGLDGSLDSLGVRVVLHPVHKRLTRLGLVDVALKELVDDARRREFEMAILPVQFAHGLGHGFA